MPTTSEKLNVIHYSEEVTIGHRNLTIGSYPPALSYILQGYMDGLTDGQTSLNRSESDSDQFVLINMVVVSMVCFNTY